MNRVVPPKEFIGAALRLYEVPAGHRFCRIHLTRIIHDPLRLVDCLPAFSAEANC
jgi:hypothetical protein